MNVRSNGSQLALALLKFGKIINFFHAVWLSCTFILDAVFGCWWMEWALLFQASSTKFWHLDWWFFHILPNESGGLGRLALKLLMYLWRLQNWQTCLIFKLCSLRCTWGVSWKLALLSWKTTSCGSLLYEKMEQIYHLNT